MSGPAGPDRPGAEVARRKSPEPAPAPPAMSPKDTQDSVRYRASNQTETEEAISKFISGLECQELSCFENLHTLLSKLPVPVATTGTTGSKMSHAAALEGGFPPKMDKERYHRLCNLSC